MLWECKANLNIHVVEIDDNHCPKDWVLDLNDHTCICILSFFFKNLIVFTDKICKINLTVIY